MDFLPACSLMPVYYSSYFKQERGRFGKFQKMRFFTMPALSKIPKTSQIWEKYFQANFLPMDFLPACSLMPEYYSSYFKQERGRFGKFQKMRFFTMPALSKIPKTSQIWEKYFQANFLPMDFLPACSLMPEYYSSYFKQERGRFGKFQKMRFFTMPALSKIPKTSQIWEKYFQANFLPMDFLPACSLMPEYYSSYFKQERGRFGKFQKMRFFTMPALSKIPKTSQIWEKYFQANFLPMDFLPACSLMPKYYSSYFKQERGRFGKFQKMRFFTMPALSKIPKTSQIWEKYFQANFLPMDFLPACSLMPEYYSSYFKQERGRFGKFQKMRFFTMPALSKIPKTSQIWEKYFQANFLPMDFLTACSLMPKYYSSYFKQERGRFGKFQKMRFFTMPALSKIPKTSQIWEKYFQANFLPMDFLPACSLMPEYYSSYFKQERGRFGKFQKMRFFTMPALSKIPKTSQIWEKYFQANFLPMDFLPACSLMPEYYSSYFKQERGRFGKFQKMRFFTMPALSKIPKTSQIWEKYFQANFLPMDFLPACSLMPVYYSSYFKQERGRFGKFQKMRFFTMPALSKIPKTSQIWEKYFQANFLPMDFLPACSLMPEYYSSYFKQERGRFGKFQKMRFFTMPALSKIPKTSQIWEKYFQANFLPMDFLPACSLMPEYYSSYFKQERGRFGKFQKMRFFTMPALSKIPKTS